MAELLRKLLPPLIPILVMGQTAMAAPAFGNFTTVVDVNRLRTGATVSIASGLGATIVSVEADVVMPVAPGPSTTWMLTVGQSVSVTILAASNFSVNPASATLWGVFSDTATFNVGTENRIVIIGVAANNATAAEALVGLGQASVGGTFGFGGQGWGVLQTLAFPYAPLNNVAGTSGVFAPQSATQYYGSAAGVIGGYAFAVYSVGAIGDTSINNTTVTIGGSGGVTEVISSGTNLFILTIDPLATSTDFIVVNTGTMSGTVGRRVDQSNPYVLDNLNVGRTGVTRYIASGNSYRGMPISIEEGQVK
mgnify:FL=1